MSRRAVFAAALAACCAVPAAAQFTPSQIQAAQKDPKAYTLDETSVLIENLGPAVSPTEIKPPLKEPGGGDVIPILDQIINIGSKIWKIIVDNKPVVDVHNQYATGLPKGIDHWGDLAGWQPPKGTVYELTAKNGYGMTMIKVRYQVLRTFGGSYKGKGRYLTAVTVEPLLVEVGWGYTFNLEASVPDTSVVNVGTSESPVAGMMPQLAWRIRTPIKDSQGKGVYWVQGDGLYREVGGPFKRDYEDKVARSLERALQYGP